MTKQLTLLFVAGVLLHMSACALTDAHQCTEIGCEDGLDIAFQTSTWPAGDYVVTADVAGEVRTCTVTLPFAAVNTTATCSAGARLGTSGSALPASAHEIIGLHLSDTPANVVVTIARDSVTIATQTFTPSYQTTRPNGPECEPECTQANLTMSF